MSFSKRRVRRLVRVFFTIFGFASLVSLGLNTARAQPVGWVVTQSADSKAKIDELGRDLDRAASLRAIKTLQYTYTQYLQFGLWDEAASLFAEKAEFVDGEGATYRGRAAIQRYLKGVIGGGSNGMPGGSLYLDLVTQPVVTLSYDGGSATGRWSELIMDGLKGRALWSGGMQINEYVRENGVWKISHIHRYPQFAGPYETGFLAVGPDFPLVPYPYTPASAGRPVPDQPSGVNKKGPAQSLEQIEQRVQIMNDEDKIRNLQNIYGYYVDRKMWPDVTDLFDTEGAMELAGTGVWVGPKSIRRALEIAGPEGLQRGQVNDHVQLSMVVTIEPSGYEAHARGVELGMLTPKLGEAYWAVSVYENRYVKKDGIWRIREMRVFPQMTADYYKGWATGGMPLLTAPGNAKPDKVSAPTRAPQISGGVPSFQARNPVTGLEVSYTNGAHPTDNFPLTPLLAANPVPDLGAGTQTDRVAEARRKLVVSKGYDAAENVSNAFGYYLDDCLWDEFAENMSRDGARPQGTGFYVGRDHIYRVMAQTHWSGPPSPTNPRYRINLHQRLQPVIDVSPDGKSAKIRTRLFLYFASTKDPGGWGSGMYPNETAVLENGVWKMQIGGEIDEQYFSTQNYKDGWARPQKSSTPAAAVAPGEDAPPPPSGITNTADFSPDLPWSLFEAFRRKGMAATNWPDIKPMWFAYRNPVSGRMPPNYCPDILKCFGP